MDNFSLTHLHGSKYLGARWSRELIRIYLDLDLYTNGVWEFHPNTILYITTKITQMTTIFSGINKLSQSILPSLSSRITGSSCSCTCLYQAAGALSTSRATIFPRNQPFIEFKLSVKHSPGAPGGNNSPETFSQKT